MDKLSGFFSSQYNLDKDGRFSNDEMKLHKVEFFDKMKSIQDNEYVEYSLRECSRDIFSKNIAIGESFIQIACNEEYKHLEETLNRFIKEKYFIEIIEDNIDDLLLYGEVIFKINKDFSISDGIKQKYLTPLYQNSVIVGVWDIESEYYYDKSQFLIFQLFKTNKKSKITSEKGDIFNTRLSKGIIPETVINKLKSLKILEDLQPIVEVQSVNEKQYFYLRFPQDMDSREAQKRVKKYELFLKRLLEMDGNINDIDTVLENMTKIKVIPLFGEQNQIEQNTITKVNRIDQSQIDTLKETISNLVNMNINKDNDDNKAYLRFISSVRFMIQDALQKFFEDYILSMIDISRDEKGNPKKKKYIYSEADLESIGMKVIIPELKGIDEIDSVDFITYYSESMKSVKDLVEDISGNIASLYEEKRDVLDVDSIVDFYNDKIEKVLGNRVFKKMKIDNTSDSTSDNTESDTEEDIL